MYVVLVLQFSSSIIEVRGIVENFICTRQRRHWYVSHETPNDVSLERHQDISVGTSHDFIRNVLIMSQKYETITPINSLHGTSNQSQMKYPTKSRAYIAKKY